MTRQPLDRRSLGNLLQELDGELARRGNDATVFVVGGAAMALAYDEARSTQDVDAAFQSSYEDAEAFLRVTSQLGQRHGLDEDWLNDGAKGMMPGDDEDAELIYEGEGIDVYVASPKYLLAMKLHSGRPGRDIDDATKLWSIAGYESEEEGIALLEEKYPPQLLLPKHRYIVQEVAARAREQSGTQHRTSGMSTTEEIEYQQQQNTMGGPGGIGGPGYSEFR